MSFKFPIAFAECRSAIFNLPLPLGMGGRGSGRDMGQPGPFDPRDIEIPESDKNRADPRFRQELLEAAKQKPPERFEEAVRRYYEELIR